FGFALFYLRSVAPAKDYIDRLTGKLTPRVTTGQIYWGAVPFVLIQVVMVALIIAFPGLVTSGLDKQKVFDTDTMRIEVPAEAPALPGEPVKDGTPSDATDAASEKDDDPAKAIERAMRDGEATPPAAADSTGKPAGRKP
ncbi:MAG: hypothetical protein ABI547_04865, partial [Betaproteobacteria bacterium]